MEGLNKGDLRKIRDYLTKVYPGTSQQDELWFLIQKIESLIKGKHGESQGSRSPR
jgi:hypothetical protein